jgi:hypothetical protein
MKKQENHMTLEKTNESTYCTDQWLVVKFPAGAGGKFLLNCLFLFDKVPHWHGTFDQQQTVEYFRHTILDKEKSWLKKELNQKWNLNFFSRTYLRDNNLTCQQFDQLVAQNASEYFRQCWDQCLMIGDHWAKPQLPEFWQQALAVTIKIDDWELYKSLIYKKLYRIEKDHIISLLDCPSELATESNFSHAKHFDNQYKFDRIDIDEFFELEIKKQPWLSPWLAHDYSLEKNIIDLSELINKEKFLQKFTTFENIFKQQIPKKYLIEMHDIWSTANEQC